MTPTFAVSIAHAKHVPGRAEALGRMLAQLETDRPASVHSIHIEARPGRPHEWSEWQWRAALSVVPPHGEEPASHCLFLNDDLAPCPDFWAVLAAAVAAQPDKLLSLYCSHPNGPEMRARGVTWYTSPEGLIGNAYVLPRAMLEEFLAWRDSALVPGAVWQVSEDGLLNLFAMATGRRVHHTVPSLVEHALPDVSCYGNEQNVARTATVPPEPGMRSLDWCAPPEPKSRFFKGNHWYLLTALRPEEWAKADAVRRAYAFERGEP